MAAKKPKPPIPFRRREPRPLLPAAGPARILSRADLYDLRPSTQGRSLEADLLPMPQVGDKDKVRMMALLVTADDQIAVAQIYGAVQPTYEAVADLLAEHVRACVQRMNPGPRQLTVRHAGLVELLAERLGDLAVTVRAQPSLPVADGVAKVLREQLGLPPVRNLPMMTADWRSWGLPDLTVTRIFQAAAPFARAAPWRHLQNAQTLVVELPGGRTWHASVLGNGGEQFGLTLYAVKEDLDRHFDGTSDWSNHPLAGVVLFLGLEASRDLPPQAIREVKDHRWPLAGPDQVPSLMVYYTPWGGITVEQAEDIALVLRTLPFFVGAHQALLDSAVTPREALRWQDPQSGVTVTYRGLVGQGAAPYLWPMPASLAPCLAQGPNADPLAGIAPPLTREQRQAGLTAWHALFEAWRRMERIRSRRVLATVEDFVVDFLADVQEVPLPAVSELDLRLYLYSWNLLSAPDRWSEARKVLDDLRTFFSFLADTGIVCPWAEAILDDVATYRLRWQDRPVGRAEEPSVMLETWTLPLRIRLSDLALIPDGRLGERGSWQYENKGPDEQRLSRELTRRWLLWRDEAIRGGTTAPAQVVAAAARRKRAWEKARHPAFGGRSPIQVIERERRGR